jgi:hypothetical protein
VNQEQFADFAQTPRIIPRAILSKTLALIDGKNPKIPLKNN